MNKVQKTEITFSILMIEKCDLLNFLPVIENVKELFSIQLSLPINGFDQINDDACLHIFHSTFVIQEYIVTFKITLNKGEFGPRNKLQQNFCWSEGKKKTHSIYLMKISEKTTNDNSHIPLVVGSLNQLSEELDM